ncbi:MAG: ATP-binding cassette domain-containing protein [Paludibacteraceae bacterium]
MDNSSKIFLSLQNVVPRIVNSPFSKPLNWIAREDEVWSIFGKNGSGKTLFSEVISGKYNLLQGKITYPFFEKIKRESPEGTYPYLRQYIKIVSFNSVYSIADFRETYYQQRFNSTESDNSPLVSDFFTAEEIGKISQFYQIFDFDNLGTRRLIQLSSGELRKLLITKVLFENPRMIIFDNPFIGLDNTSRKQLDDFFYKLQQKAIQLFFLVPSADDLPSVTTHILEMEKGEICQTESVENFHQVRSNKFVESLPTVIDWTQFPNQANTNFETAVKMSSVDIIYGNRIIAKDINWEIKKGEKWALLGPNGSGKSTLLSYIFADNPQAYSKKLVLFDRNRGTGESIWDIKERIGFTSSEMHLYYRKNVSVLKVVESGFFDSIGLYRQCTSEQTGITEYVMKVLKIEHLAEHSFLRVSSGEQRLILFARSLVKNPDVLILDEPFHGLDDQNKKRCLQIVDSYGNQPDKSIVFVTHRKEEIPKIVDRFMILK